MKQKKVPKYFGFRIILTSTFLYMLLIFPVAAFLFLKNSPRLVDKYDVPLMAPNVMLDSLKPHIDTLGFDVEEFEELVQNPTNERFDSLRQRGNRIINYMDSTYNAKAMAFEKKNEEDKSNIYFTKARDFINIMMGVSFIVWFFVNMPIRLYFNRLRRGSKILQWQKNYTRKLILHTQKIYALIIFICYSIAHIYLFHIIKTVSQLYDSINISLLSQFLHVSVFASILVSLFAYFWQNHRVHIKYVEFVFSADELRKSVFCVKSKKIKNRLLLSSMITTILPLTIVISYIVMSLTSVQELGIETLTSEHFNIIFGNYINMHPDKYLSFFGVTYDNVFFINAVNTTIMFIGISAGVVTAMIYLLFFVRWTTRDIVLPVNELLANMKRTANFEENSFSIVRTNDELGQLAEGYNIMTEKIMNYIDEISTMNRDLEKKVIERTKEIEFQKNEIVKQRDSIIEQKNEIEAQRDSIIEQKDEIETQRDAISEQSIKIEAQRDLVINQRDEIAEQKEAITDSIQYAKRIQSALLTPDEDINREMPEHFIFFKPRDIVSGDFYWFEKVIQDGKSLFITVAADCTGHGVPGAMLSMLGITFLNEIVSTTIASGKKLLANELLNQLRENIISSLHQTGRSGESKDGMDIALCIIDFDNNKLQFAGANSPLMIVRKNDNFDSNKPSLDQENQSKEIIKVKGDKMPIGIYFKEQKSFTNKDVDIKSGDIIYTFSDGYIDQFGGDNDRKFMIKNFKKMLLDINDKNMIEQKKILSNTFDDWRGGQYDQIDDVLVLGVKIE